MQPSDILASDGEFNSLLNFLTLKPSIPSFVLVLIQQIGNDKIYGNQLKIIELLLDKGQHIGPVLQFLVKPAGLEDKRLELLATALENVDLFKLQYSKQSASSAITDTISDASLGMLLLLAEIVANMLELEKASIDLKLSKLGILSKITNECDAYVLVQFLPGILGSLAKQIWRNTLENHQVVVQSINIAGTMISKTVNDVDCLGYADDVNGGETTTKGHSKLVQRNRMWFKTTVGNITRLLPLLHTFKNAHPKARLEYAKQVLILLESCSAVLEEPALDDLLDTLAYFYSDSYELVANFVKSKLPNLKSIPEYHNLKTRIELSLRQEIRCLSTNPSSSMMQMIVGQIGILGNDSNSIIETCSDAIVEALLVLYEPDFNDSTILDTFVANDIISIENQQNGIKLLI